MSSAFPSRVANRRRGAFTLVEILIVVVIMAVLAATIIPSFSNSVDDAKANTAIFNLNTIRSQIEHYKAEHDGAFPDGAFLKLTSKTDKAGVIGTGATHVYGPYLRDVPENPLTGLKTIESVTTDPTAGDKSHGWIYNTTNGKIWIDHATYFTE